MPSRNCPPRSHLAAVSPPTGRQLHELLFFVQVNLLLLVRSALRHSLRNAPALWLNRRRSACVGMAKWARCQCTGAAWAPFHLVSFGRCTRPHRACSFVALAPSRRPRVGTSWPFFLRFGCHNTAASLSFVVTTQWFPVLVPQVSLLQLFSDTISCAATSASRSAFRSRR